MDPLLYHPASRSGQQAPQDGPRCALAMFAGLGPHDCFPAATLLNSLRLSDRKARPFLSVPFDFQTQSYSHLPCLMAMLK